MIHKNSEEDFEPADENVRRILEENEYFQLSSSQSAQAAREARWESLAPGETLFYEGDPADCFYLLASGRMDAILRCPDGSEELLGSIRAGETIGEMGLISGNPRSLTVRARRSCALLRFDRRFIQNLPNQTLFRFINLIVQRSQDTINRLRVGDPPPEQIAVVAMTPGVEVDKVTEDLVRQWPKNRPCQGLSSIVFEANKETAGTALRGRGMTTLIWVDCNDRAARHICEEADRTIFLARNDHADAQSPASVALLRALNSKTLPSDLLLFHSSSIQGTSRFLESGHFSRLIHARDNCPSDLDRMVRLLSGSALGVALGGGGVRGWAHIGAFKAIREAGHEIDAVCGTSAGAVLGSLWEMSTSIDDLIGRFERLLKIAGRQLDARNFTFPVVSLLNGRNWTRSLQESLGDQLIEDFPVPFRCVSCDIVAEDAAIHTYGPAWKWVRASTSLPGLFPPMVEEDSLFVDGAVIDNLPVEVTRRFLGRESRILAVDLTDPLEQSSYYCPPSLNRFEALSLERKARQSGKTVPRLGETLLRSLMMGSKVKSRADAKLADIYVRPKLGKCSLLGTDRGLDLVEAGYEATKLALQEYDKW